MLASQISLLWRLSVSIYALTPTFFRLSMITSAIRFKSSCFLEVYWGVTFTDSSLPSGFSRRPSPFTSR